MTQPTWITAPQPRTFLSDAQYEAARHTVGHKQREALDRAAKSNGHPAKPYCYVRSPDGHLYACGGV